ncbi:hypothetical protein Baya_16055 [Bagarius yarrelli]|uniref:Uncharacterized protein n=1 Tax=Bagarius yarrelli TaxID=175774 RepID=A0A556VUA5_BAGYA|nr:hypothetical protein Baya_16055 [Bagarius yarrelli]
MLQCSLIVFLTAQHSTSQLKHWDISHLTHSNYKSHHVAFTPALLVNSRKTSRVCGAERRVECNNSPNHDHFLSSERYGDKYSRAGTVPRAVAQSFIDTPIFSWAAEQTANMHTSNTQLHGTVMLLNTRHRTPAAKLRLPDTGH